jgi:cell division protein FtsB
MSEVTTVHKTFNSKAISATIYVFIALSLAFYFSFAAVQGDFGKFKRIQVEAQEQDLLAQVSELRRTRTAIANKTRRMSDKYLDLDLLDEQARKILGMARGDDIIIR